MIGPSHEEIQAALRAFREARARAIQAEAEELAAEEALLLALDWHRDGTGRWFHPRMALDDGLTTTEALRRSEEALDILGLDPLEEESR